MHHEILAVELMLEAWVATKTRVINVLHWPTPEQ